MGVTPELNRNHMVYARNMDMDNMITPNFMHCDGIPPNTNSAINVVYENMTTPNIEQQKDDTLNHDDTIDQNIELNADANDEALAVNDENTSNIELNVGDEHDLEINASENVNPLESEPNIHQNDNEETVEIDTMSDKLLENEHLSNQQTVETMIESPENARNHNI